METAARNPDKTFSTVSLRNATATARRWEEEDYLVTVTRRRDGDDAPFFYVQAFDRHPDLTCELNRIAGLSNAKAVIIVRRVQHGPQSVEVKP